MLGVFRAVEAPPSESAFVHGEQATATSTLAVGLALRRHGSFSWADCAAPAEGRLTARERALALGKTRGAGGRRKASELALPSWSVDMVERVLVPENSMDSLRLMSYLALPSLLQELAAMSTSPSGESVVILTNADALEPGLRASVLGRADVHRRLREARVSLFVTARTSPTRAEASAFDRVFAVHVRANANWSDGTVGMENDRRSDRRARSIPLRSAWYELELDPILLPPP